MILLDNVVHVLAGSAPVLARQELFALEVTDSTDVSGVLVDIDHPWGGDMRLAQDFAEKPLGCSSTPGLIQEEIECLPGGIDSSIEIQPLASDLDIGFVNPPGIVSLLQIRATAFVYFWSISLNPTIDGSVSSDKPRSDIISSRSR